MFANCQAGGLDIAVPDVCLTPPVPLPVPYVNLALGATAVPNITNILFVGGPVHNLGTLVPLTLGDAPGSCGGVVSGTVMGPSRHITGVGSFILQGLPATRMTSLTLQNLTNVVGARLLPSQLKIALMGS
ncbi:protein of unknown function [Pseudomonas delhiensis]|uniref:Uncharacterized protein n=1 Tax=Pseudomonas delhiensis TaxID=366289 RepID=A0A239IAR7_9PSED|nr:DUF4150 domain-containing protein [Pseudomonas delhiensis]SDK15871.1 protein of unknown function [Pseudomonas delhiensis]SNS90502.1 protein of unknown function [Pseudomonas delhiensis]